MWAEMPADNLHLSQAFFSWRVLTDLRPVNVAFMIPVSFQYMNRCGRKAIRIIFCVCVLVTLASQEEQKDKLLPCDLQDMYKKTVIELFYQPKLHHVSEVSEGSQGWG